MENKLANKERLEILINAMITNYFSEDNFNSEEERELAYENLLHKTIVDGEFDDIFLSDSLEGLDSSERQRILDLSRKYRQLCLYHGRFDDWADSVEGAVSGYYMKAELLLADFDYLIRLAKNGGEDVLKFLDKFRGNQLFAEGSVIGLLINRFWGDLDTLETVLIDLAQEDGKYKDFTETQKIIMCDSPDGLLIRKNDDGSIDFISNMELKKTISNEYVGEDDYPIKDINSDDFQKIVRSINCDCLKGTVYKK